MEPHPIPQNVTSFQFRLVGDMTLKQFLYLATGLGLAYLIFVLFISTNPILAWPLVVLFAFLGVAFAFIPIGDRPLDHWLAAFLKAIYSPTKRVWGKNGKTYKENSLFTSRLAIFSPVVPVSPRPPIIPPVSPIPVVPQTKPAPPTQNLPEKLPTKEELQKTVELAKQAQQLQTKIIETERHLSQIKTESAEVSQIPIDYSEQVNSILADLQKLVLQASQIKKQMEEVRKSTHVTEEGRMVQEPVVKEKVKITVMPNLKETKQTMLTLTTFPNVINGVVKDPLGNYLEGVVVVIYDKEGLPVRALKTNKLGQFTGSTPLPNSTYTVEMEKDGFVFDVLQIELGGQIMQPMMITAKGVS